MKSTCDEICKWKRLVKFRIEGKTWSSLDLSNEKICKKSIEFDCFRCQQLVSNFWNSRKHIVNKKYKKIKQSSLEQSKSMYSWDLNLLIYQIDKMSKWNFINLLMKTDSYWICSAQNRHVQFEIWMYYYDNCFALNSCVTRSTQQLT